MWTSLIPLILASAVMPIEIVVTLMLLSTPSRARTAGAAVTGMIVVRLLQGLIFGMILHWGQRADAKNGHGWVISTVLLILSLLFLIMALRELLSGDDPDAPPPKWMTMLSSVSPAKAFLVGAGLILISVKLWVFTFAAIGAIGDAGMDRSSNVVTYIVFVLLASSTHLAIVGAAAIFPQRSKGLLDRVLRWLQDNNRVILILLGLIFGTWFLIKALGGFGIL